MSEGCARREASAQPSVAQQCRSSSFHAGSPLDWLGIALVVTANAVAVLVAAP
jgi:hypothetical protein